MSKYPINEGVEGSDDVNVKSMDDKKGRIPPLLEQLWCLSHTQGEFETQKFRE